jgi:hypothetical protein
MEEQSSNRVGVAVSKKGGTISDDDDEGTHVRVSLFR